MDTPKPSSTCNNPEDITDSSETTLPLELTTGQGSNGNESLCQETVSEPATVNMSEDRGIQNEANQLTQQLHLQDLTNESGKREEIELVEITHNTAETYARI